MGASIRIEYRQGAFMLQKDPLLPWRMMRENVELGLEIRRTPRRERRWRARSPSTPRCC